MEKAKGNADGVRPSKDQKNPQQKSLSVCIWKD